MVFLVVGIRPAAVASLDERDRVGVTAPGHLVCRLEL
jgi:hypothetical protein